MINLTDKENKPFYNIEYAYIELMEPVLLKYDLNGPNPDIYYDFIDKEILKKSDALDHSYIKINESDNLESAIAESKKELYSNILNSNYQSNVPVLLLSFSEFKELIKNISIRVHHTKLSSNHAEMLIDKLKYMDLDDNDVELLEDNLNDFVSNRYIRKINKNPDFNADRDVYESYQNFKFIQLFSTLILSGPILVIFSIMLRSLEMSYLMQAAILGPLGLIFITIIMNRIVSIFKT